MFYPLLAVTQSFLACSFWPHFPPFANQYANFCDVFVSLPNEMLNLYAYYKQSTVYSDNRIIFLYQLAFFLQLLLVYYLIFISLTITITLFYSMLSLKDRRFYSGDECEARPCCLVCKTPFSGTSDFKFLLPPEWVCPACHVLRHRQETLHKHLH